MTSSPSTSTVDQHNPWLGLASFTEETRGFFHGRDEEVAELGRRVQRKLLTILFGQSGLGKTSILRAGIVPRLRPEGYCPVYVRLDYGKDSPSPSEQIKQAIFRATKEAGDWTQTGSAQAGESLWEFLHHRDDVLRDRTGRTLIPLLIFDQFEEIFTLAQGDDFGRQRAAQFLEDLADLVENRAPRALEARLEHDEAGMERFDFSRADYRILIALREDYLAHLEGLKNAMPSVTQNRMRLARMTGTQALAAVTRPGGGLVSEEVARSIVRFIAGGAELERAEVEPSLLSLVCRELNETRRARGHPEISADLLAGSRDTILTEFYERTLADQPAGVRAFIEDELLTDSGYRESIAEERVKKGFVAAGASPESLAALIDRRLLRVEERLDVRRVELTHDVLCTVVRASRDVRHERESKAAVERQLAETRAKEAAGRRSLGRARMIAFACAVLAVGAIAGAIFGYTSMRRAQSAEGTARRAAEETRTAEQMAEAARGEAEHLLAYVIDDLWESLEPLGRLDVVRGLSDRVVGYYERLPGALRNADARRGHAMALAQRVIIAGTQGDMAAADAGLEKVYALLVELKKTDAANPGVVAAEALAGYGQARVFYNRNRWHDAATASQQAAALAKSLGDSAEAPRAYRVLYPFVLGRSAFYLLRDNRMEESAAAFAETFAVYRQLGIPALTEPLLTARYSNDCAFAAEVAFNLGKMDLAEQLESDARSWSEQILARSPGDALARRSLAFAARGLSVIAVQKLEPERAVEMGQIARREQETLLALDPTNDVVQTNLAVSRNSEGFDLLRVGRRAAGERALELAARVDPTKKITSSRAGVVAYYNFNLAQWYADAGEPAKAAVVAAEARRLQKIGEAGMSSDSVEGTLTREGYRETERGLAIAARDNESVVASVRASLAELAKLKAKNDGEERGLRLARLFANGNLTIALFRLQRYAEVEVAGRACLSEVRPEDRANIFARVGEANLTAFMALAIARQGRPADAAKLIGSHVEFMRDVVRRVPGDLTWRFVGLHVLMAAAEGESDQTKRAAIVREARETFAPTSAYPKAPDRMEVEQWLAALERANSAH